MRFESVLLNPSETQLDKRVNLSNLNKADRALFVRVYSMGLKTD